MVKFTWVVFLGFILTVTGCVRPDPAPTADERILVERLGRDPGVEILRLERRDADDLRVYTRQGDVEKTYRICPGGGGELQIVPVVEGSGYWQASPAKDR